MASSSPGSWFPGEEFLKVQLPDYNAERGALTRLLIFNFIFWVVIFPAILNSLASRRKSKKTGDDELDRKQQDASTKSPLPEKKHRSSRDKKKALPAEAPAKSTPTPEKVELSDVPSALGVMFLSLLILMLKNPHNSFSSRRVFMAPLLSQAECQHIISMANSAAKFNFEKAITSSSSDEHSTAQQEEYEMLQKEPQGWQKSRHGAYPTTDLNLVTDPFTREDRSWISHILDSRLSPLVERAFGVPASSIRANDMFVVRYDAKEGGGHRQFLRNHTDSSDISFNILLNDDFEGGGTRFWDRFEKRPFAHVQPKQPGSVLLHSALVNHEGATISRGTRMILVGFLAVDRVDPFDTAIKTGLSWQASWGCWAWLHTKFKHAYGLRSRRSETEDSPHWTHNNVYIQGFLRDFTLFFQAMGDAFATHTVEELISDEDAEEFIRHLDEAHASRTGNKRDRGALWWQGQNIKVDITGEVGEEWDTRKQNAEKFENL